MSRGNSIDAQTLVALILFLLPEFKALFAVYTWITVADMDRTTFTHRKSSASINKNIFLSRHQCPFYTTVSCGNKEVGISRKFNVATN